LLELPCREVRDEARVAVEEQHDRPHRIRTAGNILLHDRLTELPTTSERPLQLLRRPAILDPARGANILARLDHHDVARVLRPENPRRRNSEAGAFLERSPVVVGCQERFVWRNSDGSLALNSVPV